MNRYPSRGSHDLVVALAERHGVPPSQVIVAAGADAVIGYVCQAVLDPGDEVVVSWPSFPSFVRDPQKRDAVVVTVPLLDGWVDLEAMREAVTPRTRLLFIATPNNPTGRVTARDDLLAFVRELPEDVLPVIDEAYFDYLEPAGRFDAIADLVRAGDDVLALRTFSKLYGLAGLRVGYGVGPAALVAAMRKVQRGYDVGAAAQVAALASLDDGAEVEARRTANREAIEALTAMLQARGLEPLSGSVDEFRARRRRDGRRSRRGGAARRRRRGSVRCAVRRSDVGADRRGHERRAWAARRRARPGRLRAALTGCKPLMRPPGPPLSWPDGRSAPVSVCGRHSREA